MACYNLEKNTIRTNYQKSTFKEPSKYVSHMCNPLLNYWLLIDILILRKANKKLIFLLLLCVL